MQQLYISEVLYHDSLSDNSYLNSLPIIKYLKRSKKIAFSSNITMFVGENGTGKSTLLEGIAVACGFNAEGGSKNFNFRTNSTHSELWEHLTIVKKAFPKDGFFLRAESLYNVATHIDELDKIPAAAPPIINGYGNVSLHNQSHGESFLSIVNNRFKGNGLYILDEPEAALSPMRILTLMVEIDRLISNNSQIIIATHSPILMAFPNADIWEFSETGIAKVEYEQTEHYKISKDFFDNPQKMLHYLLDKN